MPKIFITLVLIVVAFVSIDGQTCPGVAPGPGWVCQDGGWLPPGHPAIRPPAGPPPPPEEASPIQFQPGAPLMPLPDVSGDNAQILTAFHNGWELPQGPVYFTAPLVLTGVGALRGHPSGRTTLTPINTSYAGPLIIVHHMASVDHGGGLWTLAPRVILSRFVLRGFVGQTGIVVRAVNLTMEHLVIVGGDTGIRYEWAVNTELEKSLVEGNTVGLDIAGYGPSGVSGPTSITTLRVRDSRIAVSQVGVRLRHGLGVLFDNTIIEGNSGVGMQVQLAFEGAALVATLRDCWFEANGANLSGRVDLVRQEGMTNGY